MGERLTTRIVREVAKAKGVEPSELEFVLYEHIDTDALSQLSEHEGSRWTLTFVVPEYEVTITCGNDIDVEELEYEVPSSDLE
jgi:hypothetical protein